MKIIELKSSNIKKIKAIELHIDEDQNLIMITGKNGQGKSSVLDSIWYALGGKKAAQDKPIRDGEEKGEIEMTIKSDKGSYIVKRTFTEKGSYLTVTNPDGAKYSNPQELLDFIVGNLSFDPLEFSRMDSKKQVAELTKIVGLDFTELEATKKKLTEDRLIVGREQKALGSVSPEDIDFAKKFEGLKETNISELSSKVTSENNIHNNFLNVQTQISATKNTITQLENQIKNLTDTLNEDKKLLGELAKVEDTKENLEELRNILAQADNTNKDIRKSADIMQTVAKIGAKEIEYNTLTAKIKEIDDDKAKKLSEAKMPIKGLSWDEDKVLFNNIPYDQLSSAEQLKISMAIAMAANPKLRMLQIRDGSLLDKDNLKVIAEMTKDKDFQAFVERVDDTGKVGIVISDGEVINNFYEKKSSD